MKAKEKAIELVDKYLCVEDGYKGDNGCGICEYQAKQCALIAVDEIINNCLFEIYSCGFLTLETKHKEYWEEVKQEIQKL